MDVLKKETENKPVKEKKGVTWGENQIHDLPSTENFHNSETSIMAAMVDSIADAHEKSEKPPIEKSIEKPVEKSVEKSIAESSITITTLEAILELLKKMVELLNKMQELISSVEEDKQNASKEEKSKWVNNQKNTDDESESEGESDGEKTPLIKNRHQ